MKSFEYAIVIDFEATCDDKSKIVPPEIIEFPAVLLDLKSLEFLTEFRSFVQPKHHPVLSDFCLNFTSIQQKDVDNAPNFAECLKLFEAWLKTNNLNSKNSVIVTCGDWDFGTMFPSQCANGVPPVDHVAEIFRRWINIKFLFCEVYGVKKAPGMIGMLHKASINHEGHHHLGIDDCRNIARLLIHLLQDIESLQVTTELPLQKHPPIMLKASKNGIAHEFLLKNRSLESLKKQLMAKFKCPISEIYKGEGTKLESDRQLMELQKLETLTFEQ